MLNPLHTLSISEPAINAGLIDNTIKIAIGPPMMIPNVPVKNKIRALEPNFLISFKSMLMVKSARLVGSKYLEATK